MYYADLAKKILLPNLQLFFNFCYIYIVPAIDNVKMKHVQTCLRSPCPSNGGNSQALKA